MNRFGICTFAILGLCLGAFLLPAVSQTKDREKPEDAAKRIQELTDVSPDATRFLSYHGSNDDVHLNKLYAVLDQYVRSDELSGRVVKTARVVARLYALQLEELDNV